MAWVDVISLFGTDAWSSLVRRSGVAAALALARRGAIVTLTELRDVVDGADALRAEGVVLETGGHQAKTFATAELIVVSPGVPHQPVLEIARQHGTEIIGELELAWRWIRGRVIAITGTKGKSTTTTLVGRMLEAAGRKTLVGGNIGVPLSAQVDDSTGNHPRGRDEQFPARGDDDVPSVDRGVAELADDHRIGTRALNRMPPPRPASSPTRPRRTGPSSTPTIPR